MSYAFNGTPVYPINSAVIITGDITTGLSSLTVSGDAGFNNVVLFQTNNGKGTFSVGYGASVFIQQGDSGGFTPALTVQAALTGSGNIVTWNDGNGSQVGDTDNKGNVHIFPTVGIAGEAALTVTSGSANTSVQDWFTPFATQSTFRTSVFPHNPDLSVNLNGGLTVSPNAVGTAMSTIGDYAPIGFQSASNAVATPLTLTSVTASVDGLAVYIGTITGGDNNAFANYSFAVTGFTNPANNTIVGTNLSSPGHPNGEPYSFFICVASTATSLTLKNAFAVAETHAATATYGSTIYSAPSIGISIYNEFIQSFQATAVGDPINGIAEYLWAPGLISVGNFYVTFTGFTNPSNNGTFLVKSSTATTISVFNSNATTEVVTTAGPLTLTSVANAAQSQTVYTGTITGGAANAFRGYIFTITGFTASNNNGTWICLASTATTLTLASAFGTSETNPATANGSPAAATTWNEEVGFALIASNPTVAGQPTHVTGMTTAAFLNGQNSVTVSSHVDDIDFSNVNPPAPPYVALTSVAASTGLAGNPFTLTQATTSLYLGLVDVITYTGTITGGAANAYLGYMFTITGFVNVDNNLTHAICIGSTATTLVFAGSGTNETHAATANGFSAVYTGTITGGAANGLRGHSLLVGGFTNDVNNGPYVCVASTATTLTLGNDAAVVESTSSVAAFTTTVPFALLETGTITSPIGTTDEFVGEWVVHNQWLTGGSTNINPNNGTFYVLASDASSVTLANPLGTAQTQYGLVSSLTNGNPLQSWFRFGFPDPIVSIGHVPSSVAVTVNGVIASKTPHFISSDTAPNLTLAATAANSGTEFDFFNGSLNPGVLSAFVLPDLTTGAMAICRYQGGADLTGAAIIPTSGSWQEYPGSTLLVIVVWQGTTTITSVTDFEGNIYTSAHASVAGTGTLTGYHIQPFITTNIVGSDSNQIQVHFSTTGSSPVVIQMSEYVACGGVDQIAISTGNAVANDFVVAPTITQAVDNAIVTAYYYTPDCPWVPNFNQSGTLVQRSRSDVTPFIYTKDFVAFNENGNPYTLTAGAGGVASSYFALQVTITVTGQAGTIPQTWQGTVRNNNTFAGIFVTNANTDVVINDYNFNTLPSGGGAQGGANYLIQSTAAQTPSGLFPGAASAASISNDGNSHYVLATDTTFADVTVTGSYSISPREGRIRVDSTSAATIYLTSILTEFGVPVLGSNNIAIGTTYRIKNVGTGVATIVPQTLSAALIDGVSSYIMNQYDSADFVWDGTNWGVF